MKLAPLEERIYRHRCVEAWSIVVPWIGLFAERPAQSRWSPPSKAKYVAFESYYRPEQMLAARGRPASSSRTWRGCGWTRPCTRWRCLCVGMYGEALPHQDGAPVRLVVPWKYGFKSIKSIVKITLGGKQPPTTWNKSNAREYGFYSNVNPKVDHPRWSQATERRLGEFRKRPTLMFNGYGDQVASLYTGMDLQEELLSHARTIRAGPRFWYSCCAWRLWPGWAGAPGSRIWAPTPSNSSPTSPAIGPCASW